MRFVISMVTSGYNRPTFSLLHKFNLAGQYFAEVVCNSNYNGNTNKAQLSFIETS